MLLPVRVCRLYRLGADTLARLLDCLSAPEVEDDERFRVRFGSSVCATTGELEVRLRSGNRQKDSVVPLVVLEATDFR